MPDHVKEQLPEETKFWAEFEDSELVEWLKKKISGHSGSPETGFCFSKFWLLARYLYIYEAHRSEFASAKKVQEAFRRTHNYNTADPLAPLKNCVDWELLTDAERRLMFKIVNMG